MSSCPECFESFDSDIGFRHHYFNKHNRSDPERENFAGPYRAEWQKTSKWQKIHDILNEIRVLDHKTPDRPAQHDYIIIYGRARLRELKLLLGNWPTACILADVRPRRLFTEAVDNDFLASLLIDCDMNRGLLAANTVLTERDIVRAFGSWQAAVEHCKRLQ